MRAVEAIAMRSEKARALYGSEVGGVAETGGSGKSTIARSANIEQLMSFIENLTFAMR